MVRLHWRGGARGWGKAGNNSFFFFFCNQAFCKTDDSRQTIFAFIDLFRWAYPNPKYEFNAYHDYFRIWEEEKSYRFKKQFFWQLAINLFNWLKFCEYFPFHHHQFVHVIVHTVLTTNQKKCQKKVHKSVTCKSFFLIDFVSSAKLWVMMEIQVIAHASYKQDFFCMFKCPRGLWWFLFTVHFFSYIKNLNKTWW